MSEHWVDLDWSGLEVLSFDECLVLLSSAPVGRVGFVDAGSPVILPVNFTMDGGSVVFRSGRGSKLATAMMERPVCLEADQWDVVEHTGWSVLAKGVAEHVLDESETERLGGLPVQPWSRPEVRQDWVRIRIDELTGRRIVRG